MLASEMPVARLNAFTDSRPVPSAAAASRAAATSDSAECVALRPVIPASVGGKRKSEKTKKREKPFVLRKPAAQRRAVSKGERHFGWIAQGRPDAAKPPLVMAGPVPAIHGPRAPRAKQTNPVRPEEARRQRAYRRANVMSCNECRGGSSDPGPHRHARTCSGHLLARPARETKTPRNPRRPWEGPASAPQSDLSELRILCHNAPQMSTRTATRKTLS